MKGTRSCGAQYLIVKGFYSKLMSSIFSISFSLKITTVDVFVVGCMICKMSENHKKHK